MIKAFKENSFSDMFYIGRRIMGVALRVRPYAVVLYLAGAILEALSSILTIYASAKLGGLLAQFLTTGQTDGIWFWLYVDILAAVLIGVGFWMMRYSDRLLYFSMNQWSVDVFMEAMCRIDINDFYDDQSRNRINKVQNGYTWQIPTLVSYYLQLLYGLLRFGSIAIVVSQISWWLIVAITIFLIPSFVSDSRIAKIQWLVWDDKGDNRHIFWGIQDLVKKAKSQMELRSMQTQTYLQNKITAINKTFYREQERKFKSAQKVSLMSKILEVGGTAIGSIIVLRQFLAGSIPLDKYFFLSGALLRIGGALNAIFGTLSNMQDSILFSKDYFKLIDTKPRIVDIPQATTVPADSVPDIVFNNVSFTYPGQSTPVFSNLSLTIKAGEHVALVGENGAGKTTLIKLLLRFYRPDSGTITIGDVDLQNVAIDTWYQQLATLFQSFNEYPLAIKDNIEIANPATAGDSRMLERAATFGGVDTMVAEYKHGWETVLDSSFKKGIEPSGGQWQRVALSRAFYRNANILILDEPTAAIDAKAEYDIFNNIFDHYKDKTALIVSHRFSTVRRAHRIVVFDQGKIIEQGSHKALIKQQGLYHELFSKQAEGYKD